LKELVKDFSGQTIVRADGNVRAIDPARLVGQRIDAIHTWGKHLLIETAEMVVRVHFLLFGTYRINEGREGKTPRLSIETAGGDVLNLYACQVREIDRATYEAYDFSADVMSEAWDPKKARKKLRANRKCALPRTPCSWPGRRCASARWSPRPTWRGSSCGPTASTPPQACTGTRRP
jgi:endonuclease-8